MRDTHSRSPMVLMHQLKLITTLSSWADVSPIMSLKMMSMTTNLLRSHVKMATSNFGNDVYQVGMGNTCKMNYNLEALKFV